MYRAAYLVCYFANFLGNSVKEELQQNIVNSLKEFEQNEKNEQNPQYQTFKEMLAILKSNIQIGFGVTDEEKQDYTIHRLYAALTISAGRQKDQQVYQNKYKNTNTEQINNNNDDLKILMDNFNDYCLTVNSDEMTQSEYLLCIIKDFTDEEQKQSKLSKLMDSLTDKSQDNPLKDKLKVFLEKKQGITFDSLKDKLKAFLETKQGITFDSLCAEFSSIFPIIQNDNKIGHSLAMLQSIRQQGNNGQVGI